MSTCIVIVVVLTGPTGYLVFLISVYMSPEAITGKFCRKAMSERLKEVITFIAIDEAHLIEDWGKFRPAYKELNYIRSCLPFVPLMALSATAPQQLIVSVTQQLNMPDYVLVSGSLNRHNLFFSLDSSKCMLSVFHLLSSMLSSVKSPEVIPKTLIFCRAKDTLYSVYVHLVRSCSAATKGCVGQYHATMSLECRSQHYENFKSGRQRAMVATSAFGLGIDIDDITEVILFGVPDKTSELVQLAGRGGRDSRRLCLVRFVAHARDLKDTGPDVLKLCSNTSCLRKVIIRDILQSEELLPASDLCCSFCSSIERPRVFVTKIPCTDDGTPIPCRSGALRSRRVLAGQRVALKQSLLKFRETAGGTRFRRRGLDGVLSMAVIDKIVKRCNKICSEEDVVPLGVVKEFSAPVFQLIEGHIPNTVTQIALRRTSDNTDVINCRAL